jgi:hypothetical protein
MYLALGVAERSAPAETVGGFIPVGSPHDALMAIAPVFGQASRDIVIVDPYMSQIVINNFALSAGESVKLRLLSGDKKTNPDIEPALRAWRAQRPSRALEVRTADQRLLHDRLIITERPIGCRNPSTCWQSALRPLCKNSMIRLAVPKPNFMKAFGKTPRPCCPRNRSSRIKNEETNRQTERLVRCRKAATRKVGSSRNEHTRNRSGS